MMKTLALLLLCSCGSAVSPEALDAATPDAAPDVLQNVDSSAVSTLEAASAPADAPPEADPVDAGSCCVWLAQTWFPGDGPILACKPRVSVLVTCPDSAIP
jgi:hypothetical protein